MFYSLPDPREVGLKWKPYEHSRQNVERIERRLRETQNQRARLEQEIRELGDAEIRELSQAILRGEDDPLAHHDEHQRLVERLRELKREEAAISQALPVAEEELRQTVFEYQHKWKEETDGALAKAIAEEHKAYAKAIELIEGPRLRRMYLEALSGWVRYPTPAFGAPSDVVARSAIQRLGGDAVLAEEKLEERHQAEQLQREQEESVA
jgi:DNA repair ATPase RecN